MRDEMSKGFIVCLRDGALFYTRQREEEKLAAHTIYGRQRLYVNDNYVEFRRIVFASDEDKRRAGWANHPKASVDADLVKSAVDAAQKPHPDAIVLSGISL